MESQKVPMNDETLDEPYYKIFIQDVIAYLNRISISSTSSIIQRMSELPSPPSYKNLKRESRKMFSKSSKFSGLNISVARVLSNITSPTSPHILFVHNFLLASKTDIPGMPGMKSDNDGYQFQCQYIDKNNGKLIGVWSPKLTVTKATRKFILSPYTSLLGEINYTRVNREQQKRIEHMVTLRGMYRNGHHCIVTKYANTCKKKYFMGSYTQSITSNIALGTKVKYHYDVKKTDLSLGLRYARYKKDDFGNVIEKRPNLEVFTQIRWKDMQAKMHKNVKISLFKKIEQNTRMATEINWDMTKRSAHLMYGFEQSFLTAAKLRVFVDSNFKLKSFFDFQLTPKTMAQVITQAKLWKNEYKFGVNLQFQ